jgi:hypothetical protein
MQITLDYDSAHKEQRVGLTKGGDYCDPDDPKALTAGTLDGAWLRETSMGLVAFVYDMKKTKWTTSEGPDSLQVHAYARAFAAKHECVGYVTGIWLATEGEWQWGDFVSLEFGDKKAAAILRSIVDAALNKGDLTSGAHCRNCWGRFHCPAQMMTMEQAEISIAKLEAGHIDSERAAMAYLAAKKMEDMCEKIITIVKDYALRADVVDPATGKVLRMSERAGSTQINRKRLEAEFPEAYEAVKYQSPSYYVPAWVKPK